MFYQKFKFKYKKFLMHPRFGSVILKIILNLNIQIMKPI